MTTDADRLLALGDEQFVSLTTFRRSGVGVDTTVWVARDGDALVVTTSGSSGKVKRIRNDPRVMLRPSTRSGRFDPAVEQAPGRAEVLTDDATTQPLAVLAKKYGLQFTVATGAQRLTGRVTDRVIVRIVPDVPAG